MTGILDKCKVSHDNLIINRYNPRLVAGKVKIMAVQVAANEVFSGWVIVAAPDNNGRLQQRIKYYEISDAITTYAAALAAIVAAAAALDAINEADIIEYGVRSKFPHNGSISAVVGNVRKEAFLTLFPAAGGDKIDHSIYSPDDTLAPSGGGVNTGYAALATYLDMFESAGALRLSDGEAIAASPQIAAARIRHVGGTADG